MEMKSVILFLVTTDHATPGTTRAMDLHCLHLQEGEKWRIVLAVLREGINFPLMPPPQKLTVKVNFSSAGPLHTGRAGTRDQIVRLKKKNQGKKIRGQWTHAYMPCGIPLTLIL